MDYSTLQTKIKNKIDKFGVTATLRTIEFGTYDAATDTHPEIVDECQIKILVEDFNARDIDGTLIQVGDKRLLLPVLDSTAATLPRLDEVDKVEIEYDNRKWNPVSITPLMPAGVPILYTVHARG